MFRLTGEKSENVPHTVNCHIGKSQVHLQAQSVMWLRHSITLWLSGALAEAETSPRVNCTPPSHHCKSCLPLSDTKCICCWKNPSWNCSTGWHEAPVSIKSFSLSLSPSLPPSLAPLLSLSLSHTHTHTFSPPHHSSLLCSPPPFSLSPPPSICPPLSPPPPFLFSPALSPPFSCPSSFPLILPPALSLSLSLSLCLCLCLSLSVALPISQHWKLEGEQGFSIKVWSSAKPSCHGTGEKTKSALRDRYEAMVFQCSWCCETLCQCLRLVAVVVFSSFWHVLAFVCSCGNQENKFVCFARLFLFGMLFTYSRD